MKRQKIESIEMLKILLPNLDFSKYEIVLIEEKENVERRKCTYKKRLFITTQEKKVPPDDSGDWYPHGFVEKKFDDWPLRGKALTILTRKRKRKNKISGSVYTSKNEGVITLTGTKKSEDLLYFLKMRR